ncbi:HD domain-containing protein [Halobacteriovorax sp. GB3]|uniref:HD-GYP domain-containing protein n=1 Tax=Halobacteriovorax sp. GB3 TaxID=2719615 RepID=UPI00236283E5|nr:HD domain-containing phosphohydrolase [Halobacteriovorax sp. GB3]MDD0851923.1 HD domain-containing protein [Halobacteriovorax sp. GB3]
MGYTPLRISTVKPNRELSFDLYIFFKETYLRYTERGTQIADEKYNKLKKQKIAKFYITENDEPLYQQFLDNLLQETMNSPTATVDEKVNLVEGACGTAVERMQKDPESESSYRMTQNAAKSLRQVIAGNPDALKKIFGKKASDADLIIKHSLNVSALSTKLAEKCKLPDEEIDNIATAALIHDVGIARMPKEDQALFKKPRTEYGTDDKRLYGFHVKDAVEVLKDKPWVTQAIIELVVNHEEVLSGQGPNKKSKLSPSEEILSLVNNYDKRIITTGKTPKETIKEMTIDEVGNYSLDLINKFKEVLQTEGFLD